MHRNRFRWLYIWKVLKGPKLTKISPSKTYSGVLGSFIISIIFSSLYFNNLSLFGIFQNSKFDSQIIFIVLFASAISQFGDIAISFFKRKSKLKDTGNIIPGHGGLLDRIDGMIFVFPFMFVLFKIM